MATKVGGTDLRARRLDLPNTPVVTQIEWNTKAVALGGGVGTNWFRGNFTFPGMRYGYMTTQLANQHWVFTPGDYDWRGTPPPATHIAISAVQPPFGVYWSEQFGLASGDTVVGGIKPIVSPEISPRLAHIWEVVDGIAGARTSGQVYSRDPMNVPLTIRWRMRRIESVTNPAGNLRRTADGTFVPLGVTAGNPTGTYWIWRVGMDLGDGWFDVADYYLPSGADGIGYTDPFSLVQEWQLDFAAGDVLNGNPVDIRYDGMRVYRSDTGRWYELLDWANTRQLHSEDPPGPTDPWTGGELAANPHGFNAGIEPGKIAVRTLVGENTIGRHVFCGLTYRRGDGTALAYNGNHAEEISAGTYLGDANYWVGPAFKGAGGLPYIQQVSHRKLAASYFTIPTSSFYIFHPDAAQAAVGVFTAPHSGTWYVAGDVARGNPTVSGDGVNFQLVARTTLASVDVPADVSGFVPDNPFAGASNRPFSASVYLSQGEEARFVVSAKAAQAFDATAFRFTASSLRDETAILDWCPSVTSEASNEPIWTTHRLGGNYELRIGEGAQDYRRRYSLEYKKLTPAVAIEREAYLRGLGRRAFLIADPDSGVLLKARVDGAVRRRPDGRFRTISVSVIEVFEP